MILPKFTYLEPKTLEEASRFAKEMDGKCKLMAGGTDIIVAMKEKHIAPEYIIDLKRISGMDYIDYDPESGLKIGALTSLRAIERSQLVKEKYKAVADAAHYVASTQVRSKGTMVGNLVNASPSADTVPILLAADAILRIYNAEMGERQIPMSEFYTGFKKTALKAGDIVTEIIIPVLKENQKAAYIKHAVRKAMDLAIVGVAAIVTMEENICTDAKIALGAVAVNAIRAKEAENILIGKELTEETLEKAAIAAMEACQPISDVRASAEYRKDMVRVFTKRAVKKALEEK